MGYLKAVASVRDLARVMRRTSDPCHWWIVRGDEIIRAFIAEPVRMDQPVNRYDPIFHTPAEYVRGYLFPSVTDQLADDWEVCEMVGVQYIATPKEER